MTTIINGMTRTDFADAKMGKPSSIAEMARTMSATTHAGVNDGARIHAVTTSSVYSNGPGVQLEIAEARTKAEESNARAVSSRSTADAAKVAADAAPADAALKTAARNAETQARVDEARARADQARLKAVASTNFVDKLFNKFEAATVKSSDGKIEQSFTEHLNEQIDALGTGDSSDPQKLARYQKAIMMFTVHTNAQSSMLKSIADLDKGVVRDFN